jgi:hypothetical protein
VKIKVSINKGWCGKPRKGEDCYSYYGNKRVNLGRNWSNTRSDYESIFSLLTVIGYAVAPHLKSDANGQRCSANFESCQLVMVDIDDGMTIQQLQKDPLYCRYGSGYYTTASHTSALPKFRILFVLETALSSSTDLILLYKWLINYYKSDASCKDATRLFYGSINSKYCERTNRILPDDRVQRTINIQRTREASICSMDYERTNTLNSELSDDQRVQIVDELCSMRFGQGDYETWRNLGWALCASRFDSSAFVMLSQICWQKKSATDAMRLWNSTPSMTNRVGVIINTIKRNNQAFKLVRKQTNSAKLSYSDNAIRSKYSF